MYLNTYQWTVMVVLLVACAVTTWFLWPKKPTKTVYRSGGDGGAGDDPGTDKQWPL